ncbi:Glycine oxidase [archaeon HR01]|nr:Glycine oxidase [archaeon HR01]
MIAIVGGGVIGLSTGWYLARSGERPVIFERGEAGRGASWASAGMLAPNMEAEPGEERLTTFLLEARRRWDKFAYELERASDISLDYRSDGILMVALNRDDVEYLRSHYRFQRGLGLDVELLDSDAVHAMEPYITADVMAGLFSKNDGHVDCRRLVTALKKAFIDAGGVLREHTEVEKIVVEDGKVKGVYCSSGFQSFEKVVIAAGAWSGSIGGLTAGVKPNVRPVRGQMIALGTSGEDALIRHAIWGPPRNWGPTYMVPRRGRILLGTTVEEMGFDTSVTAGGIFNILRGCREIAPFISDLPITEVWAGLRPGSEDDAPILGPTSVEGLYMATGHFRNGILLAPLTAEVLTECLIKGEMPEYARSFTIGRF